VPEVGCAWGGEVATYDHFNTRLGVGIVGASPHFAHSLQFNVSGLQPATTS